MFTNANGANYIVTSGETTVPANSSWSAVGSGFYGDGSQSDGDTSVKTLIMDAQNIIYVGGDF